MRHPARPLIVLFAAVTLSLSGVLLADKPALAQTQAESDAALADLAEILGALAHLEVVCGDEERSRDDMERVLASETLTELRRAVLIDAFNRGFRGVASTHRTCTTTSERLIARHHDRGATIIDGLLEP
ncbi:MAG: TIGR02301 family protein [Pseudomonadota bacterium]